MCAPGSSMVFGVVLSISRELAQAGMITNEPPPGTAGVLLAVAATRRGRGAPSNASCRGPPLMSAATLGEAMTGTVPPRWPAGGAASSRAGNAGHGVSATSAAYGAGWTMTTLPDFEPVDPTSRLAASVESVPIRTTPADRPARGPAAAAAWPAGLIDVLAPAALTKASAPTCCHEKLIWPLVTAARTMPPSAITAMATTSASAGSSGTDRARAERAIPRNPTVPRRAAVTRATARSGTGYTRAAISTAAIAMRTGAATRYGSTPAPGARPRTRSATTPPTITTIAVASITSLRADRRGTVSSVRLLPASDRSPRCSHAASRAGAVSATTAAIAASTQLVVLPPPGTATTPRATPTTRAGTAAPAVAPSTRHAIWAVLPPRALLRASSPRNASVRVTAPISSRIVVAAATPASSSASVVPTAACAAINAARTPGPVAESDGGFCSDCPIACTAASPASPLAMLVIAASIPGACDAERPPVSSGYSHDIVTIAPLSAVCSAESSFGPMSTAPSQTGLVVGFSRWGGATSGSVVQNVDAALGGFSSPVTLSPIGGSLAGMVLPRPRLTSDPSRSPNLFAVGSGAAGGRGVAWGAA